MKTLIVYHSSTENTKKLALAIKEGIENEGMSAVLKTTEEVREQDFLDADAIIAGSPVYFGGISWQLKRVFDKLITIRHSMKNKIGAAFATSGHHTGGKETTMLDIIHAMLICGMIIVGDPFESGGHYGIASIGEPDKKGEKDAYLLGQRVAETVAKFHS